MFKNFFLRFIAFFPSIQFGSKDDKVLLYLAGRCFPVVMEELLLLSLIKKMTPSILHTALSGKAYEKRTNHHPSQVHVRSGHHKQHHHKYYSIHKHLNRRKLSRLEDLKASAHLICLINSFTASLQPLKSLCSITIIHCDIRDDPTLHSLIRPIFYTDAEERGEGQPIAW